MLNTMEDLCLICSSSRDAGMLPAESSLYGSEGTEEIGIVGMTVKNEMINQPALLQYN